MGYVLGSLQLQPEEVLLEGTMNTQDRLRENGKRLEALGKAQRERFEEDFRRIYASEQGPLEPEEVITDPRNIRGE